MIKFIKNITDNYFKIIYIFKKISFWFLVWFIFVFYYSLSLKYKFHTQEADYVAYFVQIIADIFMATFSGLAFLKTINKESRKFYMLIFISIFPGLISTETYNVLVNIIKIKNVDSLMNQLWIFPYTFFLIVQILSWAYLLFIKREKVKLENKTSWVSKFPYIQSIMVIFLSIFLFILFKGIILKKINIVQGLNTILEAILFILMSVCLSRTKNKSLIYIEIGFLFLIAFNLAHRFSYLTGHYYKSFDMVWLICYVIIVAGFSFAIKQRGEKIEFFDRNSIHVLISAVFTMFSTFLFILFLSLGFLISSIEINDIGSLSIFPENIPSILVFSFSLSVLIGKILADFFSKPLEKISKRIDFINTSKLDTYKIPDEEFGVYEIEKLDKFIMSTISELQAANRVKSQFLMNMSHDFRTPASGIYHMSRSVYKRIDNIEIRKLQKLIVDSSEQLMNLLEDVLDYSRLDNDKYDLNIKEIDIISEIKDVILFVSAKAKEKSLNINTKFCESSIHYRGDKLMINRILLNIISNAIKFTHKGEITISVKKEKIDNNNWFVIRIKDTGIGIEKRHHKFIFEPFTRVESPETSKYTGIGLGLSNVFLMLKKMNGRVTVESTLHHGATFSILLPTSEAENA